MKNSPREHRGESVEVWDPRAEGPRMGRLPPRLLERTHKFGIGAIYELVGPVLRLLKNPPRVFQGITRDVEDDRGQTEGWLCFTGANGERYNHDSGERVPSQGRVLMVYINEDWDVYHWRWELADSERPDQPADMTNDDGSPRFKKELR